MKNIEIELNRIALEKVASDSGNKYLEKIAEMEKEAFAAAIAQGARATGAGLKKAFSNTATRATQGVKVMKGTASANSKGFSGIGGALKKDVTKIIKKNPLASTAAVGATGLAGGAALSD